MFPAQAGMNRKERHPYATALADRGIMALAGLWEMWRSPTGETVRSFTALCVDRPACRFILDPTSWPIWLGEEPAAPDDLKAMLVRRPERRASP